MEDADRGVEAWKEHTTAFDRVRSISQGLDRPRAASYISEQAAVSETTANDHLQRLVDMNVLRTVSGDGVTLYEPDPLYARFRTLRRLIDDHSHEELLELKADRQRELEAIQRQYEVDSPTELRKRAAEAATAEETMGLLEDASNWELNRYHLSILDDAIGNYSDYTGLDGRAHA